MKVIQRTQVSAESCCVSVIPRRYSHPVVYNDFRPARRPLSLGRGRAMTELLGTSGQEYDTRLAAVRAFMLERRLDAVLLSAPENIFYLTGLDHWGYFAPHMLIVPLQGEVVLVRSGERRVGDGCGSTCSSRGAAG